MTWYLQGSLAIAILISTFAQSESPLRKTYRTCAAYNSEKTLIANVFVTKLSERRPSHIRPTFVIKCLDAIYSKITSTGAAARLGIMSNFALCYITSSHVRELCIRWTYWKHVRKLFLPAREIMQKCHETRQYWWCMILICHWQACFRALEQWRGAHFTYYYRLEKLFAWSFAHQRKRNGLYWHSTFLDSLLWPKTMWACSYFPPVVNIEAWVSVMQDCRMILPWLLGQECMWVVDADLYSFCVRWDRSNSLSCSFKSFIMSSISCFWMPSSYSSPSTSWKWFKQVAWNTTHRSLWGFGQWSLHPQDLLTRGFKKLLQYSQQRTGNCSFFNICRTIVIIRPLYFRLQSHCIAFQSPETKTYGLLPFSSWMPLIFDQIGSTCLVMTHHWPSFWHGKPHVIIRFCGSE